MAKKESIELVIKKWISDNTVTFITVMIPIVIGLITALLGVCKRMYLQEYYKYFNIDLEYVSVRRYWDLSEWIIEIFAMSMLPFGLYFGLILRMYFDEIIMKKERYLNRFKDDGETCPMVIEYLNKDIRKKKYSGVNNTIYYDLCDVY